MAPQQLWLSRAHTPRSNTHLPTQTSQPAHWHRPGPDRADPNTSSSRPSPHGLHRRSHPNAEQTQWPREEYTPLPPLSRRRDVTWGRALRLGELGGVRKGEAAELPEPGQSLTLLGGGAGHRQRRPPNSPHPAARLASPRKHRLTALCSGGSLAPQPLFPSPQHLRTPLTLKRHQKLLQGGLGKFPEPLCQEVPGAPARPPPPPRGRCPGALPHGAGRRAPSAPGAVTRVGAVCRSRPDPPRIMRRRPWLAGPTGL